MSSRRRTPFRRRDEIFVEQTLTGFLVLSAAAVPFVSVESLQKVSGEAKGGIDIGSAAGAIGAAYLLGVIFDRFADTLLERFNRWNRLLFAIELREDNKALSPPDPFPEDGCHLRLVVVAHDRHVHAVSPRLPAPTGRANN